MPTAGADELNVNRLSQGASLSALPILFLINRIEQIVQPGATVRSGGQTICRLTPICTVLDSTVQ